MAKIAKALTEHNFPLFHTLTLVLYDKLSMMLLGHGLVQERACHLKCMHFHL